jgi:HSP20 family protein
MTISRRPSPFGELLSLRQAMDRLFEESFVRPRGAWGAQGGEGAPLPLDVSTTTDALVVEAALPGIRPEDVEITVEDGTLTIRGSSRQERRESDGDLLVQEIRRGDVSRSLSLPNGLEPDKADATFEDGILTLRIPRAEQVKPRQIRISPTTNGTQGTHTTKSASGQTSISASGGEQGQA